MTSKRQTPAVDTTWTFKINPDRDSRISLYEQVYGALRQGIRSGQIPPGTALPPQQKLSRSLGINHITLRQALEKLHEEGLIRTKRRVGSFIESPDKWTAQPEARRVGFLIWDAYDMNKGSDYRRNLYAELAKHALCLGLEPQTVRLDTKKQSLADVIQELHLSGLIAFPSSPENMPLLAGLPVPTVVLEIEKPIEGVDNVVIDCESGVYAAVRELIRLGHRDIAYVGALLGFRNDLGKEYFRPAQDSYHRLQAYRCALEDAGLPFRQERCYEISFDEEPAAELVQSWLTQGMPTAVLAFDDSMVQLILTALRQHGREVPRDLSIVGFGGITELAQKGWLASVWVNWENMARLAVQRVEERMRQGGMGGMRLATNTTFKYGGSMQPLK